MKKLLLISGLLVLVSALTLRAYFAFVPPPEATHTGRLAEIVPDRLQGWAVRDLDMAESPESSARISEFLNFDDALFRVFERGDTFVGLYIAYWSPGKASYRWAGAHTPDTCWVQNGWTREARQYSVPFSHDSTPYEPAEFGVYEKDGNAQNVYFWHLVGGDAYGYEQQGGHNIFASLIDVKRHGLNLRKEQFFIRLSSNKTLDELRAMPEFDRILTSLGEIGLVDKDSSGEI